MVNDSLSFYHSFLPCCQTAFIVCFGDASHKHTHGPDRMKMKVSLPTSDVVYPGNAY